MFNFDKEHSNGCCPECGCNCGSMDVLGEHQDQDIQYYETEVEDPNGMIERYMDTLMQEVKTKDDLSLVLNAFFNDVCGYARKQVLIADIDEKMEALRNMDGQQYR